MKRIGLVLSGGMGKGAYQIGALMALNDFFQPSDFTYVSAASIGALNAYAYLTNNLEHAYNMWESVNLQGSKCFILSVLKSSFLQDTIKNLISDKMITSPLFVPLLDASNRELNYYNFADISLDEIGQYLQASVSIPFCNKGITIHSKTFFDGAVIDNIPICPILKKQLDYIICIYFDDSNYIFEDEQSESKIIKLTFPDNKIISNSIHIQHDSIMYMINEGYHKTHQTMSHIFSDGTNNLEKIHSKISEMNATDSNRSIRLTGDIVVTNMNRFLQKFIHHNIVPENYALK